MKVIVITFLILIFSGVMMYICAQSYNELENEISRTENRIERLSNELNSLKSSYNTIVIKIDAEKSKEEVDEDRITDLMSGSITLSKQIDSKTIEMISLQSKLRNKKEQLDIIYTSIIDSLKGIENDENPENEETNLSFEILMIMEKKLNNVADMEGLQYNPSEVLSFEINPYKNDNDIYADYLNNAISEVNTKRKTISSFLAEIDQTNKLQRKVDKFISDSEFNPDLIRNQNKEESNGLSTFEGNVFDPNTLTRNYNSYSYLLNQLSAQQFLISENPDLSFDYVRSGKNISVESFVKLLKEVNTRLGKYNTLLLDKLSELNNADN